MAHIEQELRDVRKDEQLDLENLRQYLKNILKLEFNNLTSLQFSGGHANLTYLLKLDKREYVLRRPPLGPCLLYTSPSPRDNR